MQVLKDSLFYSNIRTDLDGVLEDDRQLLLQERTSCRARARKFSVETNRRRKAQEERRKQWDVQEQRLRENILQQRKQRVQDATERFQRAHLPPSQRKRQAFRKRTPNIGEALSHIQGTLSSYFYQSSFLSSSSTISRSCTPSPKPPCVSNPSRCQRSLSAADAYTKLMQEKSLANFKNSQLLFLSEIHETQSLLTDREGSSPQDHHGAQLSQTESLSSLDSLENEDPRHGHNAHTGSCSNSSLDHLEVFDCRRPQSPRKHMNGLCPSSDAAQCPTKSFLAELLNQQSKPNVNTQTPPLRMDESADQQSLHSLTQATGQYNLKDQSLGSEALATPSCQNLLTQHDFMANSEHITYCCDRNTQENTLRDKGAVVAHCKTSASPDTTPLEFSSLTQEGKADSKQQTRNQEEKYAKSSSAVDLSVISQYSSGPENSAMKPTETESTDQSHKHKPDVDTLGSLKKETKSEWKDERCKKADSSYETNSTDQANTDIPKSSNEHRTLSGTQSTHPASNVRFVKGILKKQSKYVSGDAKFMFGPTRFIFTKQVAMSIRDSVELTRAKVKEPENNKTVKKKLRWFDEVRADEEEDEERTFKESAKQSHAKSWSTGPPQHKVVSVDHQQGSYQTVHVNVPSGALETISTMPSAAQSGLYSTRQAWADVEAQLQEHLEEVKPLKSIARTGGPRVPRRVRSARAGLGPVSSRARKGTVIRPQSTTEAQHVAKTQGKIMVPRPPPRTQVVDGNTWEVPIHITKSTYQDEHAHSKPGLPVEQALYKDNPDGHAVSQRHGFKTDDGAIFAPLPPSYAYPSYETVSKGVYTLSQQDSLTTSARRGPMCGENGLCLDRTPTDEEISQLWHGVRSALATKDGDPRNFLAHNGSLSALPQARANLSHVTINGDSLISGVKAATRMGGYFLSPSNAKGPVRRQTLDSNEVKSRVCVDHSRQTPGSGTRKPPLPSQATRLMAPYPNTSDQIYQDEGSASAGHVQLAQTHGEGVGADADLPAAMETAQTQQRAQHPGLSALSLEEQRLLQSLDRLNHRLQYVQEMASGNSAVKGVFPMEALYNLSPQVGEVMGAARRRPRTVSADNRSPSHRRY